MAGIEPDRVVWENSEKPFLNYPGKNNFRLQLPLNKNSHGTNIERPARKMANTHSSGK